MPLSQLPSSAQLHHRFPGLGLHLHHLFHGLRSIRKSWPWWLLGSVLNLLFVTIVTFRTLTGSLDVLFSELDDFRYASDFARLVTTIAAVEWLIGLLYVPCVVIWCVVAFLSYLGGAVFFEFGTQLVSPQPTSFVRSHTRYMKRLHTVLMPSINRMSWLIMTLAVILFVAVDITELRIREVIPYFIGVISLVLSGFPDPFC